jgi:hypothetical protein
LVVIALEMSPLDDPLAKSLHNVSLIFPFLRY